MTHEMFNVGGWAWNLFFVAWPPLVFFGALKMFPAFASKVLLANIEQRDRKNLTKYKDQLDRGTALALEQVKSQIQAEHNTLSAAVDFMAAGQSRLREHTIEAVQVCWVEILALRDAHTKLTSFESIFTDEEIANAFSARDDKTILGWVADYRDENAVMERCAKQSSTDAEKHRPFCGDRLWLIFVVHRSVHLRAAWLLSRAITRGAYVRMLDDDGIRKLLKGVVAEVDITSARKDRYNGFGQMLGRLEAMFLEEAANVMSGSEAFAASLIDLPAGLQVRDKMTVDSGTERDR